MKARAFSRSEDTSLDFCTFVSIVLFIMKLGQTAFIALKKMVSFSIFWLGLFLFLLLAFPCFRLLIRFGYAFSGFNTDSGYSYKFMYGRFSHIYINNMDCAGSKPSRN
jgi:phosphoglycerol transferase MdoB-like AlkP superfamily enzyme